MRKTPYVAYGVLCFKSLIFLISSRKAELTYKPKLLISLNCSRKSELTQYATYWVLCFISEVYLFSLPAQKTMLHAVNRLASRQPSLEGESLRTRS